MSPRHRSRPTVGDAQNTGLLRTFIAIELDETARIALGAVQDELKRRVPKGTVRWVNPASIHLTLKFLGDTPRARLPEIEEALQEACSAFTALDMAIEGRGCFPNFRRPNVIWIAVRDPGNALAQLQEAVEAHIAPLGWPKEARPFRPHLTLGRVDRRASSRDRAAIGAIVEALEVEQIATVHVTSVSLMRSDLRPTGAVYTRLFSAALQAEPSM
ncbi:MAG: RNA 2',3'-cyclic phosphodiesterase [Anaerolineae bacterium]|nr:RNA 2',3'-cyclic phosphodiesterase [Anaerolineae bacterium]